MATLLVLAGAAGRRIQAGLRRFAVSVISVAREACGAFRRCAHLVWVLFLRTGRQVFTAATRLPGVVKRLGRSAGSAAQGGSAWRHRFAAAVGRVARGAAAVAAQTADRAAIAVRGLFRRASRLVHRAAERVDVLVKRLVLFAGGAGRRTRRFGIDQERGSESFVARQAGAGGGRCHRGERALWDRARSRVGAGGRPVIHHALRPDGQAPSRMGTGRDQPGRPALTSPIAAVPSGETKAGFVVGTLSSQVAAERMFEGVQQAGEGRTRVRLGGLLGWRYAGLQPGPRLVGTGYLVPTTNGAIVMLCHASKAEARARLAECGRAATTIVVGGERLRQLTSVDRSRKQLIGVIATLRSSRSDGRERLAAADLAPGQIRAAISLKVSHQRAARSVEQISPLENGHSLEDMATALRAAAAAYGRLAVAAATGSRSAYRGGPSRRGP